MLRVYVCSVSAESCDLDYYIDDIDYYFDEYFEDSWTDNEWAKKVLKEIDKSEFLYPKLIRTPYFGDVPYQWISGGSKQLILMNAVPNVIYDGDNLGDNCWPLLLELCKSTDISISLTYYPNFKWVEGCKVKLLNTGELIDNTTDFSMKHLRLSADEIVKDVDDIDWEINIDEDRFKANFVDVSFDDFSKYYK